MRAIVVVVVATRFDASHGRFERCKTLHVESETITLDESGVHAEGMDRLTVHGAIHEFVSG